MIRRKTVFPVVPQVRRAKMCSATAATRAEGAASARERLPFLVLESTIDLEGNAAIVRLAADSHKLVVDNAETGQRRELRWHDIADFRVEPSLGSSFLQANVAGRWVDLLRRPGNADPSFTDSVKRLRSCLHDAFIAKEGRKVSEARRAGLFGNWPKAAPTRRWRNGKAASGALAAFSRQRTAVDFAFPGHGGH